MSDITLSSPVRPALVLFAALSLACGLLYPFAVTGIGAVVFPAQAGGSLIVQGGQPVGSRLIGQAFSSPQYFWGRPSATGPMPNNGAGSGGSNFGQSNPAQLDAVQARIAALRAADPGNPLALPVDLVTASASGLDPEISVAAARYQVRRIAALRKLDPVRLQQLIETRRESQYLGFFGEPRVNVLELNLALDALAPFSR